MYVKCHRGEHCVVYMVCVAYVWWVLLCPRCHVSESESQCTSEKVWHRVPPWLLLSKGHSLCLICSCPSLISAMALTPPHRDGTVPTSFPVLFLPSAPCVNRMDRHVLPQNMLTNFVPHRLQENGDSLDMIL
jgi:hypothetical protein